MLHQWNDAIAVLASERINGHLCLPNPLGKFLLPSLRDDRWYSSTDENTLFYDEGQNIYKVFDKCENTDRRASRSRDNTFRETAEINCTRPGPKYASVTELTNGEVKLHSVATIPVALTTTKHGGAGGNALVACIATKTFVVCREPGTRVTLCAFWK
jgi:hypothetical protein